MTGLVLAEIRKLRAVRTTRVLTVIGWLLVVLSTSVYVFAEEFSGPFGGTDTEIAAAVDQVGSNSVIILIVAILLVTTEFRHGTIGRTLQLTPSRTRVLTAKSVTGASYAVAFFLTSLVIVAVVVAIGALLRSQVVTITITLVWLFVAVAVVAAGVLMRTRDV